MSTIEKAATSMGLLILLYLVVRNADNINATLNTLSLVVNNQIAALQGR
jgi:hypothetical protein